ncbi:MAG: helix-turn-helix domain-containing protein [Acidimicrobiales bacterium]
MAEEELQHEARALGDPTRHSLFRYIADAPHAVGVAELTDHVRLNHNAVRQHLAVLKDAGLVTEEVEERSRPGRPRLLYRLHPEAAGRWGTPGAYAWLANLLSDAVRRRAEPRQVGREDGRRRATELAGTVSPSSGPVAPSPCRRLGLRRASLAVAGAFAAGIGVASGTHGSGIQLRRHA